MRKFILYIFQDFGNNKFSKGKLIMFFFRSSNYFSKIKFLKIVFYPFLIFYKIFFGWILNIEIPYQTQIGKCFLIVHGQGIVINENSIIGNNVKIRHNVTIGNAKSGGACPIIEDNVDIGCNVTILGGIRIGCGSIIGAGSVVTKNVPPYTVVAGNPCKILKELR